jgi:hypothetical protein
MAEIQMSTIVAKLPSEMKKSLEHAVKAVMPDAEFDTAQLYKQFEYAVARKFTDWTEVPNEAVKKRCRSCGDTA